METNQIQSQNEEVEIDLKELFFVLLGKIHTIAIAGVALAIIAILITKICITPLYTSTTKLYVLSKTSTDISSFTSLSDLQLGSQMLEDYSVMVTSRSVINKVIENLELDNSYEEVCNMVSTNNPADTRILEISITHPDPYFAKEIADEVAKVSATRSSEIMEVQEPNIFEEGNLPDHRTSPSTAKNTVIGGILGIFFAAAIIIIRYIMDDTIQSQEDIEKYLDLNTLGIIPVEEGSEITMKKDKKKRKKEYK